MVLQFEGLEVEVVAGDFVYLRVNGSDGHVLWEDLPSEARGKLCAELKHLKEFFEYCGALMKKCP
jgi:hypothetical protein